MLDRGGFRFAGEGDRIKIFENPSALPRAFVTYRTRRAPADVAALLHALSRPTFDPLGASYVDGEPLESGSEAPRGHPATSSTTASPRSN